MAQAKDGSSSDSVVQPAVYNNLDKAPKGAPTVRDYKARDLPEGQVVAEQSGQPAVGGPVGSQKVDRDPEKKDKEDGK